MNRKNEKDNVYYRTLFHIAVKNTVNWICNQSDRIKAYLLLHSNINSILRKHTNKFNKLTCVYVHVGLNWIFNANVDTLSHSIRLIGYSIWSIQLTRMSSNVYDNKYMYVIGRWMDMIVFISENILLISFISNGLYGNFAIHEFINFSRDSKI